MADSVIKEVSSNKCFGGYQKVFSHESKELGCSMNFAVYLPPQAVEGKGKVKVPAIYWLSGLTCTEQNFIQKAGAQRYAAEHNVAIVGPDTSPRGLSIPGEDDSWDFGSGAGFYVDATQDPWKSNYRMYSYVTKELPEIIVANFPVQPGSQSITGHSMGGHGALVIALKNPGKYRSASAFCPISNPLKCPWGQKAFSGYLGPDQAAWSSWDATELVKNYSGPALNILVDQGTEDQFYKESQLLPENLKDAAKKADVPLTLNLREGYDHSYFFVSTFIGDHIAHHAKFLKS
ncbi:S-formylglutathione hydrolase isoform X2 [Bacillus rossius redtenbacheri]